MNKLKIGVIFLISLFVISGIVVAQGGEGNDNANTLLSSEQKQAESLNEEYAPDEIIVKFKAGTSDDTISVINSKNKVVSSEKIIKKNPKAVENENTKIIKKHGLDMIYLLKLPKNSDVNKMVSKYNENPDVEYAEPNYKVYVDATILDDDYFSLLWGMHNIGQDGGTADADIDALEAWDITTGSSDIVVAVIDTGVDYNHPDLNDNMWVNPDETLNGNDDDGNGYIDDIRGWDFFSNDNNPYDQSGHGTHCSGTIAAVGNNGIGVVGVSWNAKIMPLRFLGPAGGSTDDAILAIIYATKNGADIMSNSWGGGPHSQSLEDAISAADAAGILFVAAAGNTETDNDVLPHYPSSYDVLNVVSVAATDRNDALASFSNYGPDSVDLGAPGVYIASTYPRNRYVYMSGTSMAAPHVAGAAALILAQNPEISVADLKARILGSVDLIPALDEITVTGGRLNVFNCLETNAVPDTTPPTISDVVSSTTSTTAIITWTTDELANSTVNYGLTTLNTPVSNETMITSHSITLTGLSSETTYYYEVESTDAAGNTATDNRSGTYYNFTTTAIDTEAPEITDAIGDMPGTTGEPVTISAIITDNVGVFSATVYYTPVGDTETIAATMIKDDDSDVWSADVPVASDKVGNITYYINAKDAAGNNSEIGTYNITVTDNDAPVAEAGSDLEVLVGQEVTFNGSGSSDNIGIIGYSWAFGDEESVDGMETSHIYNYAGTYDVTLTVTDAAGNTDSDTLTVNVIEESDTMYIANIDMLTTIIKLHGWYTYATATVTIVDTNDKPVAGATVSGYWSVLTDAPFSKITDSDGKIAFDSEPVKNAAGIFTFTVESVVHSDLTYNESANMVTSSKSISV